MRADDKRVGFDFASYLRRYAIALEQNGAMADDLVQEVLRRALVLSKPLIVPDMRVFLLHLYHTVREERFAPAHPGEPRANGSGGARHAAVQPLGAARPRSIGIIDYLRRLPQQEREALLLVTLQGLTHEQAARVLQLPVATVVSRLNRGRESLRAAASGEVRMQRIA